MAISRRQIGLATVVTLCVSAGATLMLSSPKTLDRTRGPFWQSFGVQSLERYTPKTAQEISEVADLVVLARVTSVAVGRAAASEDPTPGSYPAARTAFIHLQVDDVVAGRVNSEEAKDLILETPMSGTTDLKSLQDALPAEASLFFLWNSAAQATKAGHGGKIVQATEERLWYTVSTLGIINADGEGLYVADDRTKRRTSFLNSFNAMDLVAAAQSARGYRTVG